MAAAVPQPVLAQPNAGLGVDLAGNAPRWRVRAVVPCYNRRGDLELLLGDLGKLDLGDPGCVRLTVTVVDNASQPALSDVLAPSGLAVEHLRLPSNTGGSGGFNAGISRALAGGTAGDPGELIWLLDSDARVEPGAMVELIAALEADAALVAAGSALVDPRSGLVHEIGGRLNRRSGKFEPAAVTGGSPIRVDYVAACSALVRRSAVERVGLMPDVFLNGDDVAWFIQMSRATGGAVAAVPRSRATHPTFDRFPTWSRYYIARNCIGPIDAMGLGGLVRMRRALRETARAVGQAMMGRDDLARLHLAGLRDALAGRTTGAASGSLAFEPFAPFSRVGESLGGEPARRVSVRPDLGIGEAAESELRRGLGAAPRGVAAVRERVVRDVLGAAWRWIVGPRADVAVVPARGRPACWLAGRRTVSVTPEGFVVRRFSRLTPLRAAMVGLRGAALSVGLLARGARPIAGPAAPHAPKTPDAPRPTLGIVVLSYNRWAALSRTLTELARLPGAAARIVVVDNSSADGSPEKVRAMFPDVELVRLPANRGAGAFNEGVARCREDAVLVLDDDSWPAPGALDRALDLLTNRADIGAVALHPRHPSNGASEWPFAGNVARDDWPIMGCGNLVRREAWERVGGYDDGFFLYRNDADLAMKLLGAGVKVHFDPAWVVWHDSPGGAGGRKSPRWFGLATRNWVWLCRRHGRGVSGILAALAGWGWAHALAGFNVGSHLRVLRGALEGLVRRPPALPESVRPDGSPLRTLLRLRLGGRAQTKSNSSTPHSA